MAPAGRTPRGALPVVLVAALLGTAVAQPCETTQDFSAQEFVVEELGAGVPMNNSLCPQFWATVPNGLGPGCPSDCPPDLRAGTDWYIGVQALPGTDAEFTLETKVRDIPRPTPPDAP